MYAKLLLLLVGYMLSKPARFASGSVFRFRASHGPPADELDELMNAYAREQATAAKQSDTGNAVQPTGVNHAFSRPCPPADKLEELMNAYAREEATAAKQNDTGNAEKSDEEADQLTEDEENVATVTPRKV